MQRSKELEDAGLLCWRKRLLLIRHAADSMSAMAVEETTIIISSRTLPTQSPFEYTDSYMQSRSITRTAASTASTSLRDFFLEQTQKQSWHINQGCAAHRVEAVTHLALSALLCAASVRSSTAAGS
jgi:hypothetical protein